MTALLTAEPSSTNMQSVSPFSGACLIAKPASVKLPRISTSWARRPTEPTGSAGEWRAIRAARRVELLVDALEPTTLGEPRLDFPQVRLRERVSAGQHADSGGVGHRLETDVDHGLAGDACGRDRAVEDVARKRLANDRSSADRGVGRALRGAYVVGRRGGGGAAGRGGKHGGRAVLGELLCRCRPLSACRS